MVRKLLDRLAAFRARLKNRSPVHVNDQGTKAEAIAIATDYFNSVRPDLAAILEEESELQRLDEQWQELVRLAHGNNKRRSYLNVVGTLASQLRDASVRTLARTADRGGDARRTSDLTPAELQLLSTLEGLLPTAAASYRQSILDLRGKDRLSYRGTASELREALRETLDHLAPDVEVVKSAGYKAEKMQTPPTMKQKARFVLTARGRSKTQTSVTEKSIGMIESMAGDVVRATYDRASLATHLETTRAEVIRIKRYVDTVLYDLLEISEAPSSSSTG